LKHKVLNYFLQSGFYEKYTIINKNICVEFVNVKIIMLGIQRSILFTKILTSFCDATLRSKISVSLHTRWMNGISEEASWIISALSVGARPGNETYQHGVSA